ncbi:MAG TPA: zf-HC2 domain-containing protein [Pyrinomonadaceae bacterium]|nr:zf-HC2 domain-containing protein [Pyrinomonadaceae bacterium]
MLAEQQAQFEERLLTSDQVYEELVIVEDELIDEYLREELPAPERERFESHFLAAPEHQEKVRFARAFTKYVAAESTVRPQEGAAIPLSERETIEFPKPTTGRPPKSGWLGFPPIRNPIYGYALAAGVLLLVVGVSWFAWRNLNSGPRDPGRVLSFVLTPGLSRGDAEGGNRLTVPADTGTIRLQLLLPEYRHESYEASLVDAEGRTVITDRNLPKQLANGQPGVVLDVSASLVPAGDYRVKLNGLNPDGNSESVASYSFRIQKP